MDVSPFFHRQKEFYQTGATQDVGFRQKYLSRLHRVLKQEEDHIVKALDQDLRKPRLEAVGGELQPVLHELALIQKDLPLWSRARPVKTPWRQILHWGASSWVQAEPRGICLIMAPWNYPFQLFFSPLLGAIAAGNTAVLKPSELAPASSNLVKKICSRVFPEEYVSVLEGGADVGAELLRQPFDLFFYTGGEQVGRMVMKAAAEYLRPVVLELGGKSPALIERSAPLEKSLKRVLWGKFLNSGQTCVAPDYLMVPAEWRREFLQLAENYLIKAYGENPQTSKSYGRIVHEKHWKRLEKLLEGEKRLLGGERDLDKLYWAPTLVEVQNPQSPLMTEEIFGPILPVVFYQELTEATEYIRSKPKPLAFYFFTKSRSIEKRLLREVSAGGVCINDVIIHLTNPHLPFGGVGNSGVGAYHGRTSFEAFSHLKSVEKKGFFTELSMRYPPYREKLPGWLRAFL